jgi:hypothetical protein
MQFYSGQDMNDVQPPTSLDGPTIVWVTHDESVFYANDDGGKGWSKDESPDLHKKGRGRSIMVSDFLCPCHGRLYRHVAGTKTFSTRVLEIGKNNEGYWTSDHVINQVNEEVLVAFAELHPNAIALFTFDQSTNHAAFAPDALRASNMNMNPGGAQAIMRPGKFSDGREQPMVFEAGTENAGQAKGIKQVLLERGIDVAAHGLRMKCPNENVDVSAIEEVLMCCARHCVASQPDFRSQVSLLEETISSAGHHCLFLPKFHCELNPIEAYWGASKRYARANCDYSFEGLKTCVPKSLESVPLASIRKYFRRCGHFIESYHLGCDYELTKYAHKKYRSHRRIPDSILQEKDAIIAEMKHK